MSVTPPGRLAYDLRNEDRETPSNTALDQAERLEVQASDYPRAIHLYQAALNGISRPLRATVLLRLAHAYRKAGQREQAIEAYRQLASLDQAAPCNARIFFFTAGGKSTNTK